MKLKKKILFTTLLVIIISLAIFKITLIPSHSNANTTTTTTTANITSDKNDYASDYKYNHFKDISDDNIDYIPPLSANNSNETVLQDDSTSANNNFKVIDVPYISQSDLYPTGCESVSAVMALQYLNIDITVDQFIEHYLNIGTAPYYDSNGNLYGDSPWNSFLGCPYDSSGWGCFAPVIASSLNSILDDSQYQAKEMYDVPIDELCHEYIDNDIPVIIWGSINMKAPSQSDSWIVLGSNEYFTWMQPMHCLLLVGYDEDYYYFNDPLKWKKCTYAKGVVANAYEKMYKQSITIIKK